MIDNSLIYQNPVIPDGFYYAKVISVEEEPSHYMFTKLMSQLILHLKHSLPDDVVLTSIIHPIYSKFILAFS